MQNLDLFQGIRFFEAFPEDQLALILPLTERRSFEDEERVLQQGQLNLDLYFLLAGAADVQVDGSFVVTVSSYGQTFGEMSIAGHSTCAATVTARGAATFLVLNFEELKHSLSPEQRDSVLKNFYQSCAEILARKLVMTNQIARTFKDEHGAE